MAEPLRPLGRPAAQVIIMRLTNHSLRSRYDRIAGRMNTDAWPGWLVVQSRRNRMWRPGCANPHRPSFGKIWSCRVSRSSPSRFKGLFPGTPI